MNKEKEGYLRKKNRKNIFLKALPVSIAIMLVIIFLGPAKALVVSISTDKSAYDSGDDEIIFTGTIDIETYEKIPLQNISLIIDGTTDVTCIFYPNGTKITGCDDFTISTTISSSSYAYGYGYYTNNYGYAYDPNNGQGYTFGNESFWGYRYVSGENAELNYTLTWNITSADPSDGDYTAVLNAVVSRGGTAHTYSSDSASFEIDRVSSGGGGRRIDTQIVATPEITIIAPERPAEESLIPIAREEQIQQPAQFIEPPIRTAPTPPELLEEEPAVPLGVETAAIIAMAALAALIYLGIKKGKLGAFGKKKKKSKKTNLEQSKSKKKK